jgi:hypothetical protein
MGNCNDGATPCQPRLRGLAMCDGTERMPAEHRAGRCGQHHIGRQRELGGFGDHPHRH